MSMLHQLAALMPKTPLSLTYKGHGRIFVDSGAGDTTLNYAGVVAGSAPAAGDLVVWNWLFVLEAYDTSPVEDDRRSDITGLGWAQSNQPSIIPATDGQSFLNSTTVAKVVTAGDLASPAVIMGDTTFSSTASNYGMWTAYSVEGVVSAISIPVHVRNDGGDSAPASIPVDSSALNAPAVALTFGWGTGTDDTPQLNGVTWDVEDTQVNLGQYFYPTTDVLMGIRKDVGGASYTVSKGDDNQANILNAGYISVS